jgi:hypothetical protein
MITAARLIAHKSINGIYQSFMQMDQMDNLGQYVSPPSLLRSVSLNVGFYSQMTHSIDSFITDSANSATALYTGKKSSVNALNVYADSASASLIFFFLLLFLSQTFQTCSLRTPWMIPRSRPSLNSSAGASVVPLESSLLHS